MPDPLLRGLYAITPTALCADPPRLVRDVDAALRGGARLIQYRDKSLDPARRLESASALRKLCESFGARLIVNDDVELAVAAEAHGVHLGLEDMPLVEARARLGKDAIIGITCADSLERARAASLGGADYLAFGAFFPSITKPDARHATLELLRAVRAHTRLPICAIGGITPRRAPALIEAGANLIAAVEGVFGRGDVRAAAHAYAVLFE